MLGSPSEDGQADADKGALAGAVVVVVVGAVPEDQIVAVDHRRKQPGSPSIEPIIGHNNRYHHSALKKNIYIFVRGQLREEEDGDCISLFEKQKLYWQKKMPCMGRWPVTMIHGRRRRLRSKLARRKSSTSHSYWRATGFRPYSCGKKKPVKMKNR